MTIFNILDLTLVLPFVLLIIYMLLSYYDKLPDHNPFLAACFMGLVTIFSNFAIKNMDISQEDMVSLSIEVKELIKNRCVFSNDIIACQVKESPYSVRDVLDIQRNLKSLVELNYITEKQRNELDQQIKILNTDA